MDQVRIDVDSYEEVAQLLYGDGAWEITKSATKDIERRQRRQAQVGLATNVVGLAAGAAGTGSAYGALKQARGVEPKAKKPSRIGGLKPIKAAGKFAAKHPVGLAAAGLGLQVTNVAGDAVANRVLARSAAKPKKVSKSSPDSADLRTTARGKLIKTTTNATFDAARKAPAKLKKLDVKVKEIQKNYDFKFEGEISKAVEDKKQVFGWASIVEMNGEPVVDLQGDYLPLDVIEKAAYDYVLTSRKGGDMHQRDGDAPLHTSDLIESFLVTPEKKEQMGLPAETPVGWWVGFKVNDDNLWDMVRDGKRPGFSIHGSGSRVEKVLS